MLKLDPETHRHCAVAALDVLARELSEEGGSPGHLNRLRHLAMMAREHVADVFAETPRAAPRPAASRSTEEGEESTRGELMTDASAAWESAVALRQATAPAEVEHHRGRLEAIARRAGSPHLRRICREALAAAAPAS